MVGSIFLRIGIGERLIPELVEGIDGIPSLCGEAATLFFLAIAAV
jgi:hypothetical protein